MSTRLGHCPGFGVLVESFAHLRRVVIPQWHPYLHCIMVALKAIQCIPVVDHGTRESPDRLSSKRRCDQPRSTKLSGTRMFASSKLGKHIAHTIHTQPSLAPSSMITRFLYAAMSLSFFAVINNPKSGVIPEKKLRISGWHHFRHRLLVSEAVLFRIPFQE
ncbi:hypothetical protein BV22DRAFT_871745 [Leucogyrophana mollusca]|uniref:Uncharacterized protein n=1 Tax=Leucogyrophana mollusca TaxID=85980 RepID=A0ACB8B3B9_9AGAM|nr:hypothetical protein BV22DRAFT_871745 [Leucogyrophana mollusca]